MAGALHLDAVKGRSQKIYEVNDELDEWGTFHCKL